MEAGLADSLCVRYALLAQPVAVVVGVPAQLDISHASILPSGCQDSSSALAACLVAVASGATVSGSTISCEAAVLMLTRKETTKKVTWCPQPVSTCRCP